MSNTLKLGIRAVAFLLIFLILLTLITLIYLPKRDAEKDETAQPVGFYKEPPHTLDVYFLHISEGGIENPGPQGGGC